MDQFLIGELGFKTARSDPCLYIRRNTESFMLIALYVDDMLLTCSGTRAIAWMKAEFNKRFEMKNLGEAKLCIGLEISRDRQTRTLSLTQGLLDKGSFWVYGQRFE